MDVAAALARSSASSPVAARPRPARSRWPSRRRGHRAGPPPRRPGRHRHRQEPGLPGAGDPVGPAHGGGHGHQEPPGPAGGRDLPFLADALPEPFTFAALKGRSNYLCLQRAKEVLAAAATATPRSPEGLDDDSTRAEVLRLVEWGTTSRRRPGGAAVRALAPSLGGGVGRRPRVPGRGPLPHGRGLLRRASPDSAAGVDVLVVNTAPLRHPPGRRPRRAARARGRGVRRGPPAGGDHLGHRRLRDRRRPVRGVAQAAAGHPRRAGDHRWSRAPASPSPPPWPTTNARVRSADDAEPVGGPRAPREAGRGPPARSTPPTPTPSAAGPGPRPPSPPSPTTSTGCSTLTDTDVAWVEGPPASPVLKVAPVDVATLAPLFDDTVAVLTSATIPAGLAERLGLPAERTTQLDVGSPFDYETNAVLYCAAHLPDPRSDGYAEAVADELVALIDAAGGRTLALFTSYRAMQAALDAVPGRVRDAGPRPGPAPEAGAHRGLHRRRVGVAVRHHGVLAGHRRARPHAVAAWWSTGCRSPGPTTRCSRPAATSSAARGVLGGRPAPGVDPARPGRRPADPHGHRPGRRRRARPSPGQGRLPVGHRAALPPMRRTRHRAEAEAFLREITAGIPRRESVSSRGARGTWRGAASPCRP